MYWADICLIFMSGTCFTLWSAGDYVKDKHLTVWLLPMSTYASFHVLNAALIRCTAAWKSWWVKDLLTSQKRPFSSAPVKGRSVYLESWHRLCTRCVQQVCGSAEKALSQPQGCVCAAAWGHSAATQSQDYSPASCWMKGSLCSPGLTRLSSLPVCPTHPTRSFLFPLPLPPPPPPTSCPKTEGGCPHGHLDSMRTSSPFSLTSPPLM